MYQLIKRNTEHIRTALYDLARTAGGKILRLEFFLHGFKLKILYAVRRAHFYNGSYKPRKLIYRIKDLFHLVFRLNVYRYAVPVACRCVNYLFVNASFAHYFLFLYAVLFGIHFKVKVM